MRHQLKIKYLLILLLSLNSLAIEGVYEVIIKKQQEKANSRWSLGSYLAQKSRISLMDQWLALNTESNIFELILDYGVFDYKDGDSRVEENLLKSKFFITILGLEYASQNTGSNLDNYRYNATLRFFGSSSQSTHFNFLYGKKKTSFSDYGKFENTFHGLDGDLYLLSFLGLTGSIEKSSSANSSNYSMESNIRSYGAFIELWILRFYYERRAETYKFKSLSGSGSTLERRDGDVIGFGLYF